MRPQTAQALPAKAPAAQALLAKGPRARCAAVPPLRLADGLPEPQEEPQVGA